MMYRRTKEPSINYSTINYVFENQDKIPRVERPLEIWKAQVVPCLDFLELMEDDENIKSYTIKEYNETFYDTDQRTLIRDNNIWIKTQEGSDIVIAKVLRSNDNGSIISDEFRYENLDLCMSELTKSGIQLQSSIQPICHFKIYRVEMPFEKDPLLTLRYDLAEYEDGDIYAVGSAHITSTSTTPSSTLKELTHSFAPCRSKLVEYLRRYEPDVFDVLVKNSVASNEVQLQYLFLVGIEEVVIPKLKVMVNKECIEGANKRSKKVNPELDALREAYAEMYMNEIYRNNYPRDPHS